MKLLGRTRKVGCTDRTCQRIATYHFFMPARKDAQGRNHAAYEVYSCANHASHYQRFSTTYNTCSSGYIIQSASVNEYCHL